MARLSLGLCFVALSLLSVGHQLLSPMKLVAAEQLQLASILPKLEAIHADTKTLLLKNTEIKAKILVGLQAQINDKIARETQAINSGAQPNPAAPAPIQSAPGQQQEQIDFSELDEFNKWVEVNLQYAIKNTQASIEALKEEAQNTGMVEYSEQAINDGIEGVKYWQAAVIFQDKTLKREKFDSIE